MDSVGVLHICKMKQRKKELKANSGDHFRRNAFLVGFASKRENLQKVVMLTQKKWSLRELRS